MVRTHLQRPVLIVGLLLFLSSSLALAQTQNKATIDCTGATPGAFTSFAQAIAASPDNTVFLVLGGTCTENLLAITLRNNLDFSAAAPVTILSSSPKLQILSLTNSQNISFSGPITISGGSGTTLSNSMNISFQGVTIQNSLSFGILSVNSQVQFLGGSVSGNTGTGIGTSGGTLELGGVNISNNGHLGIDASTTQMTIRDSNGPTTVSHNGTAGVQLTNFSAATIIGATQITGNAGGNFGLLVSGSSNLLMVGGMINGNTGIGVACQATSDCEFSGVQINGNTGAGIDVLVHSELDLDTANQITGNGGTGILIDQGSSLGSGGGNTITNNADDAVIINALSLFNFTAPDTITATAGNLALNCNNGSVITGDISTYKPKKCGAQFQANPIH